MVVLEFRTFGGLELRDETGQALDDVLAKPKRVALLTYLVLGPGRHFQRRDTVLGMFWSEVDQDRARRSLRQTLFDLRRALGADVIVNRGDEEIGIDAQRLRCDVSMFEALIAEENPESALALYRGDFFLGFHLSDAREFEKWMDNERTRLRTVAEEAAWSIAEKRFRGGDNASAIKWARRAAAMSPTSEIVIRRLINLLERTGDKPAALRVYRDFDKYLTTHYELRPSRETQAMIEALMKRGKR